MNLVHFSLSAGKSQSRSNSCEAGSAWFQPSLVWPARVHNLDARDMLSGLHGIVRRCGTAAALLYQFRPEPSGQAQLWAQTAAGLVLTFRNPQSGPVGGWAQSDLSGWTPAEPCLAELLPAEPAGPSPDASGADSWRKPSPVCRTDSDVTEKLWFLPPTPRDLCTPSPAIGT